MSKSTRHIIIAYIAGAISAIAGLFLFAIAYNALTQPDPDQQERLMRMLLESNSSVLRDQSSEACAKSTALIAYYDTCARQLDGKTSQPCSVIAEPESAKVPTSAQEAKDLLQHVGELKEHTCNASHRQKPTIEIYPDD